MNKLKEGDTIRVFYNNRWVYATLLEDLFFDTAEVYIPELNRKCYASIEHIEAIPDRGMDSVLFR